MEITANTLDDLMFQTISSLLKQSLHIEVHKGVVIGEIIGATLRLTNPRARLSLTETKGKTFSALGELLWYLAKTNRLDFIEYYIDGYHEFSDDKETVYGAYGPRLFNMDNKFDQVINVVNLLQENPNSRKAVIQLFRADDIIEKHSDIPCTCVIQLMIRNGKLNMVVYMRSNDAFLGLPHDVFSFTMLQEICSCMLNVELGEYVHMAGNLHLYEARKADAERYIGEGLQSTKVQMPPMSQNDITGSIATVLEIEEKLRSGCAVDLDAYSIADYWKDIARMLLIFRCVKDRDIEKAKEIASSTDKIYKPYTDKKLRDLAQKIQD